MNQLVNKIEEAVEFIKKSIQFEPEIAIILGTGLGKLADEINIVKQLEYKDIPNFPLSTVETHSGKLVFGQLAGKRVVAMVGRFHFYEGYSMQEITLPVRVMSKLDARTLIVSNACGSMNPLIKKKNIMLIADHINLLPGNPLIGINDESFGPRFVDMSEPYSEKLIELAEQVAIENNIKIKKGVYVAMTGPSLETRAEYRFLRIIGADVVGMSTVPETIAARQMGMKVLGLSIVTDECYPDSLKAVNIEEIIECAAEAETDLALLVSGIIERI